MQNLYFGLKGHIKVYDLKGSETNRLNYPPADGKSYTGQDTNFKIDKDCKPYLLDSKLYTGLMEVLETDSNFLREHEVIDYSLLVIECRGELRLGIIDFMRPYHLFEKI